MKTMNVAVDNPSTDFSVARRQAVGKAGEVLSDPVIIAWKDDRTHRFAPEIPGGAADRWHDYGESNGGKLELTVGDDFHFIFSEAADFDQPDLNLSSISEADGTTILCLNDACTREDLQRMGHFPGGGIGG
jgi:hypothetical protein